MSIYRIYDTFPYSQRGITGKTQSNIYYDHISVLHRETVDSPELDDILVTIAAFDRMPRSQQYQAIGQWCAGQRLTLTHYYQIRAMWLTGQTEVAA